MRILVDYKDSSTLIFNYLTFVSYASLTFR